MNRRLTFRLSFRPLHIPLLPLWLGRRAEAKPDQFGGEGQMPRRATRASSRQRAWRCRCDGGARVIVASDVSVIRIASSPNNVCEVCVECVISGGNRKLMSRTEIH